MVHLKNAHKWHSRNGTFSVIWYQSWVGSTYLLKIDPSVSLASWFYGRHHLLIKKYQQNIEAILYECLCNLF